MKLEQNNTLARDVTGQNKTCTYFDDYKLGRHYKKERENEHVNDELLFYNFMVCQDYFLLHINIPMGMRKAISKLTRKSFMHLLCEQSNKPIAFPLCFFRLSKY
jgi:hypothetical protein